MHLSGESGTPNRRQGSIITFILAAHSFVLGDPKTEKVIEIMKDIPNAILS